MMSAADVFRIDVKGSSCHGAQPEEGIDATVAASAIVMNLQSVVSRELPPKDVAVVTAGELKSGTRFNIISGEAYITGTVRTFRKEIHDSMEERISRIAKDTAAAFRCDASVKYDKVADVLDNDPGLTKIARSAAAKITESPEQVIIMDMTMGAEDFAAYDNVVKGTFVCLGGGGKYPQHSEKFVIDEQAMITGTAWYIQVAEDYLSDAEFADK